MWFPCRATSQRKNNKRISLPEYTFQQETTMDTSPLPAFVVYQEESLDSLLEEGRRKYIGEEQFAFNGSSPSSPSISQGSSSHPSSPSFDALFGSSNSMNIDETMSSSSQDMTPPQTPFALPQYANVQQQFPMMMFMNQEMLNSFAQFQQQQAFGNQMYQQQAFQGSMGNESSNTAHRNQQDKSAWTFVNNDSSVYEPEDDQDGAISRKLICNGRIIRKNKKSQAYDQFIMKWVFK